MQGSNEDADIETDLSSQWGKERGMNWKNNIETDTLPYVKITSISLLYDAGTSNPVLCDNLEGSDGVGGKFKKEGTYIHLWLIHVDVWQKPTQYCKVIILQLKIQKRGGTEGMGVYHKKGEKKERQ